MSNARQLTERARQIAQGAHQGQQYRAGSTILPYFEGHVAVVAGIVEDWGYDDKTVAVAYLHDVIEDTQITAQNLLNSNIPQDVVDAVKALTRDKQNEALAEYIARVCLIPRAVVVKFADSTHNLQTTTATKDFLEPDRYENLRNKYEGTLSILRPIVSKPEELDG